MRAKKAAEKLVESKFTDDVVQQKSKLKAVSYRCISAAFVFSIPLLLLFAFYSWIVEFGMCSP